jgi:predicted transglutaminase-like cysteine proteinase
MLRAFGIVIVALACAGAAHAGDRAFASTGVAPHSALSAKWREAQRLMSEDAARLAACRAEPWMCSADERQLDAIAAAGRLREGRARIGEINRAVNLLIRPVSDERRFGVADRWSGPLETVDAGAGDCEDYAILKLLALREAGVAPDDLKLLIVRDRAARADHAVAAVRLDARWLVLDNRTFALVDLEQTGYRVLAQLDPEPDGPSYAALDAAQAGGEARASRGLM